MAYILRVRRKLSEILGEDVCFSEQTSAAVSFTVVDEDFDSSEENGFENAGADASGLDSDASPPVACE